MGYSEESHSTLGECVNPDFDNILDLRQNKGLEIRNLNSQSCCMLSRWEQYFVFPGDQIFSCEKKKKKILKKKVGHD